MNRLHSSLFAILLMGCGEAQWTLYAWGEDFAEKGIPAEAFADDCEVMFTDAVVTADTVRLIDDAAKVHSSPLGQLNLRQRDIATDLVAPAGRYASFEVDTSSVHIAGSVTCGADTVSFDWTFDRAATYTCEPEQLFASADGAANEFTVHLDHFFIDAFGDGELVLRGGHILAADLDEDGVVSVDELAATRVDSLDLDPAGVDVSTLHDWMATISTTLGHVDGEQHCETE